VTLRKGSRSRAKYSELSGTGKRKFGEEKTANYNDVELLFILAFLRDNWPQTIVKTTFPDLWCPEWVISIGIDLALP
jgi:hypothetical protein